MLLTKVIAVCSEDRTKKNKHCVGKRKAFKQEC